MTSYRDKETGKVRQRSEYKGKEIIKDNISTLRKPRSIITAWKVLDSAPYIIYSFAEDFGMQDSFISALDGLTSIREAARRIVIRAARTMTGSSGSIDLHTGIHDGSVKEDRDLTDFIGLEWYKWAKIGCKILIRICLKKEVVKNHNEEREL